MSRKSRRGRKEKYEFRKQLDKQYQEQINEFLNPVEQLWDREQREDLEYEMEYSLYDYIDDPYSSIDDEYDILDDPYDLPEYEDEYDDGYYEDDEYDPTEDDYHYLSIHPMNYITGSYYKDEKSQKTYLCTFINGRQYLINVHTGQAEEVYTKLKKIG